MKNVLHLFLFLSVLSGCGVKGKPLPPLTPAEMGRGEPTYRGATKPSGSPATQKYLDDEDWPEPQENFDRDADEDEATPATTAPKKRRHR